jgi:hypothetical protein
MFLSKFTVDTGKVREYAFCIFPRTVRIKQGFQVCFGSIRVKRSTDLKHG